MNTYLTIITTVLVLTQIVRLIQNVIQLHRQEKRIEREIDWVKDANISKRDFEVQRDCYYLLLKYLERKLHIDYGAEDAEEKRT